MSISLIRDRVKVEILRDTSAVARIGFGVPLFIGEKVVTDRVTSFANLDEVLDVYVEADEEYKAALAFFTQQPQPRQIIIGYKDAGETYTEALSAIRDVNDSWFCVAIESRLDADALAISPAVSALPGLRQFWFRSADADILAANLTTDIASQLQALNYDQVRVVYHSEAATAYPDLAVMGRVLPVPENATSAPGVTAWHDQPIVGITGGTFSSSQRSALEAKNAEFFIDVAGAVRTQGGKMAGGEWGDVMHGLAWLETRLSEDVYELMARTANRREKIAFNDQGIAQIESVVRNRLTIAVNTGLINSDFELSVPLREDTQFGDRVARILKDVKFDATLQGAIKFTDINGVVSA